MFKMDVVSYVGRRPLPRFRASWREQPMLVSSWRTSSSRFARPSGYATLTPRMTGVPHACASVPLLWPPWSVASTVPCDRRVARCRVVRSLRRDYWWTGMCKLMQARPQKDLDFSRRVALKPRVFFWGSDSECMIMGPYRLHVLYMGLTRNVDSSSLEARLQVWAPNLGPAPLPFLRSGLKYDSEGTRRPTTSHSPPKLHKLRCKK